MMPGVSTPPDDTPRIWDCFTYFDEERLLRLRLETLAPVVHRFVIAEATRTFTGAAKPLHFRPERFADFADRIVHVVVDDLAEKPATAWDNEHRQRDALARGLAQARPDDWVIVSDVDEIPNPAVLHRFDPAKYRSALLLMRLHFYFLDNELVREGTDRQPRWDRVRMTTVDRLRGYYGGPQNFRTFRPRDPLRSVTRLVDRWRNQRIDDAGWHFSWMMGVDKMIEKIGAFSHTEFDQPRFKDPEAIRRAIAEGRDLFGRDMQFALRPLDASYPAPLLARRAAYADLIAGAG